MAERQARAIPVTDEMYQDAGATRSDYSSGGGGTSTSGGGGGGGMFGGGYAQAGAQTYTAAVNWITFGQERKQIERWREEDLAIAKDARQSDLAQRAFENRMTIGQFDFTKEQADKSHKLARDQFDFGKMKWGKEFALTDQQYRDVMKRQKEQDRVAAKQRLDARRDKGLARLTTNLNNALGEDLQMKQYIAKQFGARG